MGRINVKTAAMLAFALASQVGGSAGYLRVAAAQQVTPMFGMWMGNISKA